MPLSRPVTAMRSHNSGAHQHVFTGRGIPAAYWGDRLAGSRLTGQCRAASAAGSQRKSESQLITSLPSTLSPCRRGAPTWARAETLHKLTGNPNSRESPRKMPCAGKTCTIAAPLPHFSNANLYLRSRIDPHCSDSFRKNPEIRCAKVFLAGHITNAAVAAACSLQVSGWFFSLFTGERRYAEHESAPRSCEHADARNTPIGEDL